MYYIKEEQHCEIKVARSYKCSSLHHVIKNECEIMGAFDSDTLQQFWTLDRIMWACVGFYSVCLDLQICNYLAGFTSDKLVHECNNWTEASTEFREGNSDG